MTVQLQKAYLTSLISQSADYNISNTCSHYYQLTLCWDDWGISPLDAPLRTSLTNRRATNVIYNYT